MAYRKPNMDMVVKVRSRLKSEGSFNGSTITTLRDNLQKKREKTHFLLFKRKIQLDETISALSYLLENEIS
tara:strand:+ start:528 stop:740 length:213 start_codon:yes stop_codon:yes gene_type:complete